MTEPGWYVGKVLLTQLPELIAVSIAVSPNIVAGTATHYVLNVTVATLGTRLLVVDVEVLTLEHLVLHSTDQVEVFLFRKVVHGGTS